MRNNKAESRAFIFDMDGVVVNSEPVWEKTEEKFFSDLIGRQKYLLLKPKILGSTTDVIYDDATRLGLSMSRERFFSQYDDQALEVYGKSELTPGIDDLIRRLVYLNFKLGLVTSSRWSCIRQVLPKLENPAAFKYVVSLSENKRLRAKPAPDGYLEAMGRLRANADRTVILEDSNKGIKSAKASGALTLCLRENLPPNYVSQGADIYVERLTQLSRLINLT